MTDDEQLLAYVRDGPDGGVRPGGALKVARALGWPVKRVWEVARRLEADGEIAIVQTDTIFATRRTPAVVLAVRVEDVAVVLDDLKGRLDHAVASFDVAMHTEGEERLIAGEELVKALRSLGEGLNRLSAGHETTS